MALAPHAIPFEIADLARLRSRALAPLFEAEQGEWRQRLHWDYRPSVEMLRKHIDAHTLPGFAALVYGEVAGYTFYVQEDSKGLIGDLYVLEPYRQHHPNGRNAGIATLLLEQVLDALTRALGVRRIETQLIAFGTEPLEPIFLRRGFQSFPRLFMYRGLSGEEGEFEWGPGGSELPLQIERWDDIFFEPMADLIVTSYSGHLDSSLNDQYRNPAGALRFLKNIVIFPGCGVFQSDASWVARENKQGSLVGAVLTSQVAPRIGHITQICLRPNWQGRGLGRALLETALASLVRKGFQGISLTVTAENQRAVQLYQKLQFRLIHEFTAYTCNLKRPRA